jgi:molecular chaperone GrpE (heat shock protein)
MPFVPKSAAKPAAKPVAKPAAKPAGKPASKTSAKPAAPKASAADSAKMAALEAENAELKQKLDRITGIVEALADRKLIDCKKDHGFKRLVQKLGIQ